VEPAQVDTTHSVDGVPIRLTEERWFHIVENHDEVAGYYDEVLDTVARPEVVLPGHGRSLIAVRNHGLHRNLCVIYRQLSPSDGFIITAYFSRKIDRRKAIWSRS
jgi:hypothetical protein